MADIDLTLNMGLEGSLEAKRLVIHTIEQINQNRGMLGGAQRGKLAFLTREFNVGKLALPALEEALKYVENESISMARAARESQNKE